MARHVIHFIITFVSAKKVMGYVVVYKEWNFFCMKMNGGTNLYLHQYFLKSPQKIFKEEAAKFIVSHKFVYLKQLVNQPSNSIVRHSSPPTSHVTNTLRTWSSIIKHILVCVQLLEHE